MTQETTVRGIGEDYESRYGFKDDESGYDFKSKKGLDHEIVEMISRYKKEPLWMREARHKALDVFLAKPMPTWGNTKLLSEIDFENIHYYVRASDRKVANWEDLDPEIKRTYDRLGVPEAERKFLAGVTAQYECLTGDTLVMANPAAVPIRAVEPGMNVYALDEESRRIVKRRVLGVASKGERPVFEVSVGGRLIKCTANHPFLQLVRERAPGKKRGRFHQRWTYLSDLKPGDYVAVVKSLPDHGEPFALPRIEDQSEYVGRNQHGEFGVATRKLFNRRQKALRIPESTTDSFMWIVGLYLGDGFLRRAGAGKEKGIVDIAIPASDTATRARLRSALAEVFSYVTEFDADPFRIRIHSKPIARLFAALGLDAHARTKSVPKWVFKLPRSQRLAFIGGYIDSDGYVRNSQRNSDSLLTSVNEALLKQVQAIAIACGLHAAGPYEFISKSTYKGVTREGPAFRLLLSGDLTPLAPHSIKVARDFRPRKYAHDFGSAYKSPIDSHTSEDIGFARIRAIEAAGVEAVYDIEVEGAHNFVAQGVVVHNSEVVYHSIRADLEKLGVQFTDMDTGLREHEETVRKHFATVIPAEDNKFAALNTAVWSGGSFVYVPKGVKVEIPLQAYFRINTENMGQFERTLIIADEGSSVHYIEGCTAPTYSSDSLHSAVVELIAMEGAKIRYTTIQNWSKNVYNLVTKRAVAHKNARVEWIDGNLGSKLTMKYPAVYLVGEGAHAEILSVAFSGRDQHQDAGSKVIHAAPNTTSVITSKSVSKDGGRGSYRGLVKVHDGATGSKVSVKCDALLLDERSRSDTYPTMEVDENRVAIEHEATVSKVGEEQLFYLQSRGLSPDEATLLIVNGFIEPFTKELPMEYAVELNRLIQLEMEGAVG